MEISTTPVRFTKRPAESLMTVGKPLVLDTASVSSPGQLPRGVCLPSRGLQWWESQHQWGPTQWGLVTSWWGRSGCGAVTEQSVLSLAAVGWAQAQPAGTLGILCLPAKSGFQVPHHHLGDGRMGVARPCEGPLFVTGGSLGGGCGELGSGPGKEGWKRTGKREQNCSRPTKKDPGQACSATASSPGLPAALHRLLNVPS